VTTWYVNGLGTSAVLTTSRPASRTSASAKGIRASATPRPARAAARTSP
jgi:hypothetical protein